MMKSVENDSMLKEFVELSKQKSMQAATTGVGPGEATTGQPGEGSNVMDKGQARGAQAVQASQRSWARAIPDTLVVEYSCLGQHRQ